MNNSQDITTIMDKIGNDDTKKLSEILNNIRTSAAGLRMQPSGRHCNGKVGMREKKLARNRKAAKAARKSRKRNR